MIERPILFSTAMVQAILKGTKTQTRRTVKYPPFDSTDEGLDIQLAIGNVRCPYGQKGERLWVRESWAQSDSSFIYQADGKAIHQKWTRNIYMPKAACRLFLEIVNVRFERLQDISEDDAIAEGIYKMPDGSGNLDPEEYHSKTNVLEVFKSLWDAINRNKGNDCKWESNPWVWVIEFKKV